MPEGDIDVFRKKEKKESCKQGEIHKYKQSEILQVEEKLQKQQHPLVQIKTIRMLESHRLRVMTHGVCIYLSLRRWMTPKQHGSPDPTELMHI